MNWVIWATILAVIWTNNEILNQHMQNKTKPSYNFWVSVTFSVIALAGWFIVRFN